MKILNLIVLLFVITVNALANILPINNVTTGEVSALYDNYFTPAGFTFSIWSVIYLGLLVFSVYQFFSKSYNVENIGYLFVVNGLANIAWIFAWHYAYFLLTIPIMFVLLGTLIAINLRIESCYWIVKIPFRIYLGWICVATVANIAVYLKYLNVLPHNASEDTWGMVLVMTAGIIGAVMSIKGWGVATLTIAWGIWGIYSKQVYMGRAEAYQYVCLAVIAAVILISMIWLVNSRRELFRSSYGKR